MSIIKSIFYDHRYLTSIIIRYSMIFFIEFMYYKYNIVMTDIDYHVFSDGAKHIAKFESPYERETYRYTPILAFLMIPNIKLFYTYGKFFLSTIDVLVGYLIERLLIAQNKNQNKDKSLKEKIDSENSNAYALSSLFYLYNPLTIIICTRGSADCIITFLVLLSLILLENKKYYLSAFVYGFAVHFKIYPIIYAPAIYLYLVHKEIKEEEKEEETPSEKPSKIKKIFKEFQTVFKNVLTTVYKPKFLFFILIAVFTFLIFIAIFYKILGYKFLYEYLLYHIVRKDHRHNYSLFYYLIYLTYDSQLSKYLSLITFLPQMILIMFTTILLYKKINLCLIVLTMIFVAFNKVITAQYFIWYLSLVPLIVKKNKLFGERKIWGLFMLGIWGYTEGIWNYYSHLLEYNGQNKFMAMW
ncbi:MAG: hypothetical protein MJ252_25645, partial [archaeon]|nr:hypothetical protein [archaeon]